MDLTNWALQTSLKFTSGVKYPVYISCGLNMKMYPSCVMPTLHIYPISELRTSLNMEISDLHLAHFPSNLSRLRTGHEVQYDLAGVLKNCVTLNILTFTAAWAARQVT